MLVAIAHIEFVKGIPAALEQDSYFDVNKRNLIVFDDQMIDTIKDKRIVNLFTRDFHHRNLSVIYYPTESLSLRERQQQHKLQQSLLGAPKKPQDKLQILTLVKQIYPGKTELKEAVKTPFGYQL